MVLTGDTPCGTSSAVWQAVRRQRKQVLDHDNIIRLHCIRSLSDYPTPTGTASVMQGRHFRLLRQKQHMRERRSIEKSVVVLLPR